MKRMMERMNKKGFTLAELLIVVAIIAVLVAISVPIFNSQLEKSRDAVTVANLRTAYAEAQTAYLTKASGGNATFAAGGTGDSATVEIANVVSKGRQAGFSQADAELPFTTTNIAALGGTPATYTIVFAYDDNGAISSVTIKGNS